MPEKGIFRDIELRLNPAGSDFSGCEKCQLRDTCSDKRLYCNHAIMGLLKGTRWEPLYPEVELKVVYIIKNGKRTYRMDNGCWTEHLAFAETFISEQDAQGMCPEDCKVIPMTIIEGYLKEGE